MTLRPSLLLCLVAAACATPPAPSAAPAESSPAPGRPLALPSRFEEGRVFVQPVTRDGQKLEFYTDTGGGLFLWGKVAERLKLTPEQIQLEGRSADMVRLPDFRSGEGIPLPEVAGGRMPVRPSSPDTKAHEELLGDGMLGMSWFSGRVWTFDYPGRKLWLRAPGDVPAVEASHQAALGFPTGPDGERYANFPRIQVKVDGETLDLLFDTGATLALTEAARQALGDGSTAARATSFIVRSTFERWHQRHPDWRVIEDADALLPGSAYIEVPEVEVAGYTVGPVGFTTRPDKNFHEYMSKMMDKQVEGALGGSALRFFRVTVDYPKAVAAFEKP